MKKLIAIAAMALTTGAFAADSYLYWMLDSELSWANNDAPTTYNTVKIGVMNNETGKNAGYLNLYAGDSTSLGTSIKGDIAGCQTSAYAKFGATTDGYSYYIELLHDSTIVGRSSDVLSYSALNDYITSSLNSTAVPVNAWTVSSFTTAAIPEPTSGLLMLLGLSALALRRKRQA